MATPSTPTAYLSFRAGDTDRETEQLRHSLEHRVGEAVAWAGLASVGDASAEAAVVDSLRRAAVVLVVVGPRWLESRAALEQADDPVRRELLEAIERRLPMLVVLVRGARMVRAADLPPELTPIAQRPSVEINPTRWEFDVTALVELVKPLLGQRRVRAPSDGSVRSAPMPLDLAQDLRDRAARLAPGTDRAAGRLRGRPWAWALAATTVVGAVAVGWRMVPPPSPQPATAPAPASSSASPLQAALERLATAQTDAAVAAAIARASARAADAAAATAMPADATPEDRRRWQADIERLRGEAQAAERRAADLGQRAAEAQAALEALRRMSPGSGSAVPAAPTAAAPAAPAARPTSPAPPPAPSPSLPQAPPPPAVPAPEQPPRASPATGTSPAPPGAPAIGSADPATVPAAGLTLANWAISTSTGCGAGELRAVGTQQISITPTAGGILVSQTFQGIAGPWRLNTSGSAVFPTARATYEIESSGLWTRDGARPFRSISRLTVSARDGGMVPSGARGSQYRTERPGG